jgi:hypothetical protein
MDDLEQAIRMREDDDGDNTRDVVLIYKLNIIQ